MKVLLAVPTIEDKEFMGESRSFRFVANYIPSLGLGYLASCLRREGVETAIQNPVVPVPVEHIVEFVKKWNPDILGLSLFTSHVRGLSPLLNSLKEKNLRPFIVLGGPHVSALPVETHERYGVDMCVYGEGEITLVEIVRRMKSGDRELRDIPGTTFICDNEVRKAAARPHVTPLDQLPFPARDLMPPLKVHKPTPASVRRLPMGVIMTSRGCPYPCTFCDRSVFGKSYRAHSPEYVISEMKEVIHKYGAREIRFFDDDIAVDRNRAFRLAELISTENFGVPWTCNMSAKSAEKELMKAFKKAGCWQVLYGLESGSEHILPRLKRHLSLDTSENAVRIAIEAGIRVRADFLVGTPGETINDMWKTVQFAIKLNVDMAHFNKFVPFPGTDISKDLIGNGYTFNYEDNWSDRDNANLVYELEGVDKAEYRAFLDLSYKRFYLRPLYILRRLSRIRTWTEFTGHVRGVFTMLFL